MKVIEEDYSLRLPRDPNRSAGVHLSDVLRSLAFMANILDAKYDIPIEESDSTLMQIGLAWESYLAAYQHPEIEFHSGELFLDGIYMSPDGVSVVDDEDYADVIRVDKGDYLLHEFKLTRKSCRGFRELVKKRHKKALLWLWQIMAYRHAMNQLAGGECYVAKLHVMFVNGNYSYSDSDPESRPTYKVYRMHFTEQELQENWDMVIAHRDWLVENGKLKGKLHGTPAHNGQVGK